MLNETPVSLFFFFGIVQNLSNAHVNYLHICHKCLFCNQEMVKCNILKSSARPLEVDGRKKNSNGMRKPQKNYHLVTNNVWSLTNCDNLGNGIHVQYDI